MHDVIRRAPNESAGNTINLYTLLLVMDVGSKDVLYQG